MAITGALGITTMSEHQKRLISPEQKNDNDNKS